MRAKIRRSMEILLAFLASTVAAGVASAQPPDAAEFQRASTTHRLAEFPKIHKDGRVWFQYKAPKAQQVQLRIGNANARTYDMERLADGTWNLVIPSPGPGPQLYTLIVDGVTVMDPGSETFYSNGIKAEVEIPSPGEDFYDIKHVPHGDVLQHWFYSKVTQAWRRMYIYLPPAYDSGARLRYPVLYLQHGAGEDETEWTHAGRAQFILDNLLAEKKIVPMVVVMNNGFANRQEAAPTAGPGATNRFAAFEETLILESIPEIDANFRTIADRDHRALAGLSMGGMQTFQIGTTHTDVFSYLGMFSGTPQAQAQAQVDAVAAQGKAFAEKVHLLWFGVGTNEASFYARTQEVRAQLERAGIPSGYYESPGTGHEFQTWRRCLREFAPLLFRAASGGLPAPVKKK